MWTHTEQRVLQVLILSPARRGKTYLNDSSVRPIILRPAQPLQITVTGNLYAIFYVRTVSSCLDTQHSRVAPFAQAGSEGQTRQTTSGDDEVEGTAGGLGRVGGDGSSEEVVLRMIGVVRM